MKSKQVKALKCAFPHTLPILAGFLFLGMGYGIYMNSAGFSFVYPLLTSIFVFGGSLEFLAVSMLLAPYAPLQTFLLALIIQARHLFYGISMLEKYKNMGWKKFYLIFGLCDETFSINFSVDIPEGVDKGWFMFFVTLLNQIYWVTGATVGGLLGSVLKFSTNGIEFIMTAMFVVIFMEQWMKEKQHISSIVGLISTILCRYVFGKDNFMIPSMICILISLFIFKKKIEKIEMEGE